MTKTSDDLHDIAPSEPIGRTTRERLSLLEERVRKVELAVAERGNPVLSEDQVAERVLTKLSTAATLNQPPEGSDRVLVLASTHDDPPPPPKGAVLHPPETVIDPTHRTWFLAQLFAEFRLMVHMYFDPRYRISRTTQFALPGLALVIVLNYILFATWFNIPLLGPLLGPIAERVLDLLLCVLGYKLLIRELQRYRDVLSYLSRYSQR